MKKIFFFKPVFYRLDNNSILFRLDDFSGEYIRLPQFPAKKEIKSDKDLEKAMEGISDFLDRVGILSYGEPFAKSSIKTVDGMEKTFFFSVETIPDFNLPEDHFWLPFDNLMKFEDKMAWWDRGEINTYIPDFNNKN